jgi:hypothetical protein
MTLPFYKTREENHIDITEIPWKEYIIGIISIILTPFLILYHKIRGKK